MKKARWYGKSWWILIPGMLLIICLPSCSESYIKEVERLLYLSLGVITANLAWQDFSVFYYSFYWIYSWFWSLSYSWEHHQNGKTKKPKIKLSSLIKIMRSLYRQSWFRGRNQYDIVNLMPEAPNALKFWRTGRSDVFTIKCKAHWCALLLQSY